MQVVPYLRRLASANPADEASLAYALDRLSGLLGQAGRSDEGLAAIEEAVKIFRRLAADAAPERATALDFPVLYALMSGSWACVACWSRCGRSDV
jgi:hypothetical protein